MDERVEGVVRGREVRIHLDGKPIRAYEGESIGAALHASGVRSLSRSIKYHRPRGLFCMSNKCASCLMRVDGVPNVRVCVEPVRDGQRVKSQNSWPHARRDVLNVSDKVFWRRFDYHDKFIRPRFLTGLYHWVIRRMAGFGSIPPTTMAPPRRPPIRVLDADLVVAGGGSAGLGVALAAADEGLDVTLLEESRWLGGDLHLVDREAGRDLAAKAQAHDRIRLHLGTPVVGVYGDDDPTEASRTVVAKGPDGLLEMRPRGLVVATGTYENPPLFPANDLPGIMGARAALLLLHRHGVLPGRRVVVLGAGPLGRVLADDLDAHGVEVRTLLGDTTVERAHGGNRITGLTVRLGDGTRERLACDTVAVAMGTAPRLELLQQAGARFTWDEARGGLVPILDDGNAATSPRVWAAGEAAGLKAPQDALDEGLSVGREAARALAAREVAA